MALTRGGKQNPFEQFTVNVVDGGNKTGPFYNCVQEFLSILTLRSNPQAKLIYKEQLELLLINLIALEGDPECNDSEVFLLKAQICASLEKYPDAKEAFEKALQARDIRNIQKLPILEQLATFWMMMRNLNKTDEYLQAGEIVLLEFLNEHGNDNLPKNAKELAAYFYVTKAIYHEKLYVFAIRAAEKYDPLNPHLQGHYLKTYNQTKAASSPSKSSSPKTIFAASQPPATNRAISSPIVSALTVTTDEKKQDVFATAINSPSSSVATTTPDGNSPVTSPNLQSRTTPRSATSSAFFPLEAKTVDPATLNGALNGTSSSSSPTTLTSPRNIGQ